MANKRIKDLPKAMAAVAGDVVAIDGDTTRSIDVFDLPVSEPAQAALDDKADIARTITAGAGLDGGGTLASDISIGLSAGTIASLGKADTAVQPGALAPVATSGAYADLSGRPTLGTAAAANVGDFATAAQAVPPGGTTGQVLAKVSSTNNDVVWGTPAGGGDMSNSDNLSALANKTTALSNIGILQYSLKNFGAVGNGVADDTAAVNAAIAACVAAGGGTIYCPKNTYLITAATTVYSVPIRWVGEPGTIFKCVSASDITFFKSAGGLAATKVPTINVPYGFNYLHLNNVTGISVGSLLQLGFSDANLNFGGVTLPVAAVTASAPKVIGLPNSLSVASGSDIITVNYTAHGRVVGDPVLINAATALGGGTPNGTYKVTAVISADVFQVKIRKGTFSSTVTNGGGIGVIVALPSAFLSGYLPMDVNPSAVTKNIQVMTPINGGGMENIDFDATGSTGSVTAVHAQHTAYQVYRNLKFKGFKSAVFDSSPGCAFLLDSGYANTVDNLFAEDCGSGGYNDLCFVYQTRMFARALRSARAFGFGPGILNSAFCYIDNVTSDYAGERGFKMAGMINSVINSIDMSYAGFTGVAIANGTKRNVINVIRARGASNASVWFSDQYNTGNYFGRVETNGTFDGNDISIGATDIGNTIASLSTTGTVANSGAKIGGMWIPYVPTVTAGTGSSTFTVSDAKYTVQGNVLKISTQIVVSSAGTGGANVTVPLPPGFVGVDTGKGFGVTFGGVGLSVVGIGASPTSFAIFKAADGSSPIGAGVTLVTTFEIAIA